MVADGGKEAREQHEMRQPENLVACPSHRLEARQDDAAHDPIRDHSSLGLVRPHLVHLVRGAVLVDPHGAVNGNEEEERPACIPVEEVVVLVRQGGEEYGQRERRLEGEEDDEWKLGEGDEACD